MRKKHRVKGGGGFTLVELLTVVGIIVVLMGLLIPSIYTAREKAKQAKCASNIRQLLVGLNLYEQEYKTFPVLRDDGTLVSSLYPSFIDSKEVFHCPNHRNILNEHFSSGGVSTCYSSNDNLPAGGLTADNPDYAISQTVLIIDSLNDAGANTEPRHSGGSNLGFADGHVEWYTKRAYTGADPNNSANVGWKNWGRKQ
jgi:prepilin-type processing-associated H-X9-DG protein